MANNNNINNPFANAGAAANNAANNANSSNTDQNANLFGAMASAAASAAGAEGATEYEVKSGDSLSKIGQKYGVSWKEIYEANRDTISDPDLIHPGQKLKIPAGNQ